MFKILISTLLSCATASMLFATTKSNISLSDTKEFNESPFGKLFLANADAKVFKINRYKINGGEWLQVRTNYGDFFLSKDYKYLALNNGMAEFNQSTNEYKKVFMQDDFKYVKKEAAFTIGNGKKEVIMFSNPECSACKSFTETINKNFPEFYDEYKVYFVLIEFKDSEKGKNMLRHVFNEKNLSKRKDIYENIMNNIDVPKYLENKFTPKEIQETNEQINLQHEIFNMMGGKTTPSVFSFEGEELDLQKMTIPFLMEKQKKAEEIMKKKYDNIDFKTIEEIEKDKKDSK